MTHLNRNVALTLPAMLVLVLGGCDRADGDPRVQPPLVRVIFPLKAGNATRDYTGIVAARVQSDLGFRISGKIVERLVQAGEVVRRGQPLMRIDADDLGLSSQASRDVVEAARARATQTSADERRLRDLISAGAVSASAYDQAKAASDAARAQLSAAEAQANMARNAERYSVLVADTDGTVVETLAEPGQVISAGQIVVRLACSGPREALVRLPETMRPPIGSVAQARTFEGAAGSAILRQLSGAADPATRTYEARYILSGRPAQAPIGATVTISLAQPGDDRSTEVPLGSIRDVGKGPGVWLVRNGAQPSVSWRPVRIVSLGEETATITTRLRSGDRIVAIGAHLLHEGQPVRVAAR